MRAAQFAVRHAGKPPQVNHLIERSYFAYVAADVVAKMSTLQGQPNGFVALQIFLHSPVRNRIDPVIDKHDLAFSL